MAKISKLVPDKPSAKTRSVNVRVSEDMLSRFARARKLAAAHGKLFQLTHIARTAFEMALTEMERKYGHTDSHESVEGIASGASLYDGYIDNDYDTEYGAVDGEAERTVATRASDSVF